MRARRFYAAALAGLAGLAAGAAWADDPDAAPQQPLTQRHETLQSAVDTPAEDLNLKKTPIPEVLERAVASPYDMRTLESCEAIGAEVARIDTALGPDKDAPPPPDTRNLAEKGGGAAATALKAGIEWVIPYRGVVRMVSGADAYDKKVQAAIEAGFARRGFLKGMAVKMNCAPPASPAWYAPTRAQPQPQRQAQTYAYNEAQAPAPRRQPGRAQAAPAYPSAPGSYSNGYGYSNSSGYPSARAGSSAGYYANGYYPNGYYPYGSAGY